MKKLIVLAGILLISACASKPEIVQRIPFNPAEFAELPSNGTAIVMGQAFIKAADGKIYYPQNQQARLNPVTSYSKQWYEVNYLGKKNLTDADPRYLKYVFKTDFSHEGQFKFNNVPAGDYYISAPIFWMDEIKMADGSIFMQRHGTFVCQKIHVEEGKTIVTNITAVQADNITSSGQTD